MCNYLQGVVPGKAYWVWAWLSHQWAQFLFQVFVIPTLYSKPQFKDGEGCTGAYGKRERQFPELRNQLPRALFTLTSDVCSESEAAALAIATLFVLRSPTSFPQVAE